MFDILQVCTLARFQVCTVAGVQDCTECSVPSELATVTGSRSAMSPNTDMANPCNSGVYHPSASKFLTRLRFGEVFVVDNNKNVTICFAFESRCSPNRFLLIYCVKHMDELIILPSVWWNSDAHTNKPRIPPRIKRIFHDFSCDFFEETGVVYRVEHLKEFLP